MKHYITVYFLIILTLCSCGAMQQTATDTADLRQEAKDFSLSLVELYFTNNCEEFYSAMSDSLLLMDGDGILSKNRIKSTLCQSFKRAILNKDKTYQDYLNAYKIDILTAKDLQEKFGIPLPEYFKSDDINYFFIGAELKEGIDPSEKFIWDDMFVFMVTKKNQVWKLRGISG